MVVSIIAIIGGGIIPSFSQYLNDQNLKQAQEQLKSDLRTIQNKALTGPLLMKRSRRQAEIELNTGAFIST